MPILGHVEENMQMMNVPIPRIALVQRKITFNEKAYGTHPRGYKLTSIFGTCLIKHYRVKLRLSS